jgi:type IV pilus assembly protein PilQ|tara:strand:+ start:2635 stop:4185 length:1551 start_codon:yes stop_codon:yes gene_type:complete
MKNFIKIILFLFLTSLVSSCATTKKGESVHGKGPLIKTSDVVVKGRKDMDEMVKAGPKPYDPDFDIREGKRKTITTETVRNYVSISEDYGNLKQNVSLNLNNIDFGYAMGLMAYIGDVNILVGDEISGTITAKISNVSWDVAFQTLLDMKTLGADIDAANGIIRVHTPEKLTSQETFKSARAEVLKKKIQLEESVEPILAEIFRLYYISPEQAKTTLEDLFSTQGAEGATTMDNIKITVENTTRSIIVRGHKNDLDVIDAVIREIDVKTKQVLIEAFIVDVTSKFAKALGTRIGAMSETNPDTDRSTTISGTVGGAATTSGGVTLGAGAGTIAANTIAGATSGIGILKQLSTAALKIELEALQTLGFNNILSQPSVFTLNNQQATITQGDQIPYQTTSDGTTTTEFKEAALSLVVTPSIIGDGNVLLDIQVNNDSAKTIPGADEPGILTNEIKTKLLVSDGDIVVIGGIKKNTIINDKTKTPGLGDVPVVGNLFKSKTKSDELKELLIFISPRVIG